MNFNMNMNNAKNIISTLDAYNKTVQTLSLSEFLLAQSIVVDGVLDKDAEETIEEETEMVYIPKKGWVKQAKKQYNRKHILKDKAKAGYHNGTARMGEGRYDYLGKDVKLAHDTELDIRLQFEEMEYDDTFGEFEFASMVSEMMSYLNMDIYTWGMNKVYYHFSHEFQNMTYWAEVIDNFKAEMEQVINDTIIELYSIVDDCYYEVSMSIRNEVVELIKWELEQDLARVLQSMMDYCVRNWKEENFPEF